MTTSVLPLLLWLLVSAAFVAVTWQPYSQHRWPLFTLILLALSIGQGYVSYRLLCSRPLTCDIGSRSDYALPVSLHFAAQAAVGYGAALGFVAFAQRRSGETRLSVAATVLGALVTTGASYVSGFLLALVWPWPL